MNQVTTVLSVVKRLEYFESQIDAINAQTIPSDIFVIWRNDQYYFHSYPAIIYRNESKHFNSLYGRFFNSLHIKTPYVFICDDDLLPGKQYLEKCINFSKSKNDNVVISSFGVDFKTDTTKYEPLSRIDQDVFLDSPKKVDMGGQGWFMKTELLKLFLLYPFFKEESGEDIHFSFCLFQAMVDIFVLDKDRNKVDTWQDTTLGERGLDDKAQWKQKQHNKVRDELVKHYVELGWKFQAKSKI